MTTGTENKVETRYICNQEDHKGKVCRVATNGFNMVERGKVDNLPLTSGGMPVSHNWVPLAPAVVEKWPELSAAAPPDKVAAQELKDKIDPVDEIARLEIVPPPKYALGDEVLIRARVVQISTDGRSYHLQIPTFGSSAQRMFEESHIIGLAPKVLPPEPDHSRVLLDKDNNIWLWREVDGIKGWVTQAAFTTYRTWVLDFVERHGPFIVLVKEGVVG